MIGRPTAGANASSGIPAAGDQTEQQRFSHELDGNGPAWRSALAQGNSRNLISTTGLLAPASRPVDPPTPVLTTTGVSMERLGPCRAPDSTAGSARFDVGSTSGCSSARLSCEHRSNGGGFQS
jgi:hypothetical protein